jgi:hypothetical protein
MKKTHQRTTNSAVTRSLTTSNAAPEKLKDAALSKVIGGLTPAPPEPDPTPDTGTSGPS